MRKRAGAYDLEATPRLRGDGSASVDATALLRTKSARKAVESAQRIAKPTPDLAALCKKLAEALKGAAFHPNGHNFKPCEDDKWRHHCVNCGVVETSSEHDWRCTYGNALDAARVAGVIK